MSECFVGDGLATKFFAIYRGDSFGLDVHVRALSGGFENLTGVNARAHIRDSADVLVDVFDVDMGEASAGTVSLGLSPAKSGVLPVGEYLRSDLELTYPSGDVVTVLVLSLFVVADVSHNDVPGGEGGEGGGVVGDGDANFTSSFNNTATVTVVHNLGKRPSVFVLDSAGDEVVGVVQHGSINHLTVSFSAPFSGSINCN